jgi:hypothetical protein
VAPTATLVISNATEVYTGAGLVPTVTASVSSVAGSVTNILVGGAASQTTAGVYAVTADFVPADTANYSNLVGLAVGNFEIVKATPNVLLLAPTTVVYDGTVKSATVTGSVAGVASNVKYDGAATAMTAGTYAVTADFSPTDTANYSNVTAGAAGNFTIVKGTPTLSLLSPTTVVYDGTAQAVTVTSLVAGAVSNVKYDGAATATTAGTYAVTADYSPTDMANYSNVTAGVVGTFTILKGTPTLQILPPTAVAYDGTAKAATVTGSVAGVASSVKYNGADVVTNAGPYAVTADYTPTDTANYSNVTAGVAGTFTIEKVAPTATLVISNATEVYTGAGLVPTVTASVSSVAGSVTNIHVNGAASQTTVGVYTVTADFVPADTANYSNLVGLAAGTFEISKATPTATVAVSNSPVVYTGSAQAPTLTLSGTNVAGAVVNILAGGAVNQTTAGVYAVTANFVPTDTANYNTLVGLSAGNFEIVKATPTLSTLPVAGTLELGQALSASALTGGAMTNSAGNPVPGGFAWQTATTRLPAGTNGGVAVVFTPTDSANYNTAALGVSVIVRGVTAWIESYPGAATNDHCANGINTYYEAFVAGFSPTNPLAQFVVEAPMLVAGQLQINFSPNLERREYQVLGATNLMVGFDQELVSWTNGGTAITLPASLSNLCYKINVRLPQ